VTAVEQASEITLDVLESRVAMMNGGANLSEVVDALNMLGVGAADLVVILEALKQAGALQAEMVIL
jgi:flagellar P-ring protein precursor FlgI